VVGDPDPPSEHCAITDDHTARETHLSTEQAVHTDLDIMANHHEIIDLSS
jgi:hypothetical protein